MIWRVCERKSTHIIVDFNIQQLYGRFVVHIFT